MFLEGGGGKEEEKTKVGKDGEENVCELSAPRGTGFCAGGASPCSSVCLVQFEEDCRLTRSRRRPRTPTVASRFSVTVDFLH